MVFGVDPLRVVLIGAGSLLLLVVGGFVGLVVAEPDRSEQAVSSFEGEKYGFSYPEGWKRITGVDFPLAEATGQDQVGDTVFGIDRENWVSVHRAPPLDEAVLEANIDQFVDYLDGFWPKFVGAVEGGQLVVDPRRLSRAELPGYELRVRFESVGGILVEQRIVGFFEGETQYIFNCQHRPAAGPQVAREVASGCSLAVESFRPGPVS